MHCHSNLFVVHCLSFFLEFFAKHSRQIEVFSLPPLFSWFQCHGAALALHQEGKHPQPVLRSTRRVVPVVVRDLCRHAKTPGKNLRTAGAIFL